MTTQNKITLKNVKHAEFASQETNCFEASIYFEGKRVGTVSNGGYGGCDDHNIINQEGWKSMMTFVDSLPQHEAFGKMFDTDLDNVVCDLLTEALYAKDLKKHFRKVAICVQEDGELTNWGNGQKPTESLYKFCEEKGLKVLNKLPFAEALAIYRKAVEPQVA